MTGTRRTRCPAGSDLGAGYLSLEGSLGGSVKQAGGGAAGLGGF